MLPALTKGSIVELVGATQEIARSTVNFDRANE